MCIAEKLNELELWKFKEAKMPLITYFLDDYSYFFAPEAPMLKKHETFELI